MGPAIGETARRLGKPFMPWQQLVADVLGEIDPETGRLAYQEFGLTVPRQSGKSTLILAKAVHRSSATQFFGRRQHILYTAQTRAKAREKFEEDYAAELASSLTFRSKFSTAWGNGNEHIRFANGSRFGIEANTEKAGHGGTLDEAYIDEAFAQADGRLEQAFRPAMITRPNTQLGVISTAGWTDGSEYLQAKVARGRTAVEAGLRSGLAYFEWSAPQDADPSDPDVWRSCMPALGFTISEVDVAAQFAALTIPDFRRAFLNQWVSKFAAGEQVIPAEVWDRSRDRSQRPVGPLAFAVDVPPNRSTAWIGTAGRRADGRVFVEIVPERAPSEHRGTSWVVPRLVELNDRWRPVVVVVDRSGPAASLVNAMLDAGLTVETTTAGEMAAACGGFYDDTIADQVRHGGQISLDRALAAATKRALVDRWAWSRSGSVDISPLVAVTLARFGLLKYGKPKPAVGVPVVDRAAVAQAMTDDLATVNF